MSAAVGADDGDSVNVELNVVPFIDLMSCLTAFLLVTAVWSQYSQVKIKPKGIGQPSKQTDVPEIPMISVLLTEKEIYVGLSPGPGVTPDKTQISNLEGGTKYDWVALGEALKVYREMDEFKERDDIEIAAEDGVTYQDIVTAMDWSIGFQFENIGYVDPTSLSVKSFTE